MKEFNFNNVFTRRSLILAGGQGLLLSTIIGRLFYLQQIKGEHYSTLANGNRIRLELITPVRGRIFASSGEMLAYNKKSFKSVLYIEDKIRDLESLNKIIQLIGLDEDSKKELLYSFANTRIGESILIKEDLSWDEVSKIELNTGDLSGIAVENYYSREYPISQHSAHIIGYVRSPTPKDAEDNRLYLTPGFKIGKSGIEKIANDILEGKPGIREAETNARSQFIRELSKTDQIGGKDVILSVNMKLQQRLFDHLSVAESASAAVMNVKTGNIIAMATFPSFDSNIFTKTLNAKTWNEISNDPRKPLINKFITGEYPPGSIFKIVIAIAGLEQGLITPKDIISCRGSIIVSGHKYHCMHSHGGLNIIQAIAVSCDVFFYELARRVGIERIHHYATLLGFNKVSGIELTNEKSGLIPTKQWKKKRYKENWYIGDTIQSGIGQGFFLTTPMQLLQLLSIVARGGDYIPPSIIKGSKRPITNLGISKETLNVIRQAVFDVVNAPYGTGSRSRPGVPNWDMCGKTSTSQISSITARERELGLHKSMPWHRREHAIFAGFAPFHDPKYSVCVLVEHGGGGGKAAAPIAAEIMKDVYALDQSGELV